MTAQDVYDYLKLIKRRAPDDMKLQVVFEPKGVWSSYHMSTGCSKRSQFKKRQKIVFRLER